MSICAKLLGNIFVRSGQYICALNKLVSRYNKRHLAQEDYLKETKSKEELEKAKSTIR